MNDKSVKFYKDGYTDLRGRFNYASLNTDQLKSLLRFTIFVSDSKLGSIVKECIPPGNITKGYEELENQRKQIRKLCRESNIKHN